MDEINGQLKQQNLKITDAALDVEGNGDVFPPDTSKAKKAMWIKKASRV